jgi:SP family sugar porter-like MFS transporter
VAALGGLLFGYDWVVIGGAKPFYEAHFGVTAPSQQAWAMSCALIGCLVGAVCSGALSEAIGRRRALILAAAAFALSSLGTGLAVRFFDFVAWRVSAGVAIGMASVLSPVYIAEIAPAKERGRLVCLNELTIVVGILSAQIVNWLIAQPVPISATVADIASSWNGRVGWRLMFAAALVPATVLLVGAIFIPESPRWLGRKARWSEALVVLERLSGRRAAQVVVGEMRATLAAAKTVTISAVLRQRRVGRALLVGIVLAVLQQWCGINVIFNYAQEVFSAAGYGLSSIMINIVITGVVMCVFTFVAIASVEKLGRRPLMLIGCAGLAVLYAVLGWLYLTHQQGWPLLVLVVAAIGCYAMTLAPITWVILSEIFPNEARGACVAICTTALWAACFVLTYTFPLFNAGMGPAFTFWLYAVICAGGFLFVFWKLPETKGRSLEEIERQWSLESDA